MEFILSWWRPWMMPGWEGTFRMRIPALAPQSISSVAAFPHPKRLLQAHSSAFLQIGEV